MNEWEQLFQDFQDENDFDFTGLTDQQEEDLAASLQQLEVLSINALLDGDATQKEELLAEMQQELNTLKDIGLTRGWEAARLVEDFVRFAWHRAVVTLIAAI